MKLVKDENGKVYNLHEQASVDRKQLELIVSEAQAALDEAKKHLVLFDELAENNAKQEAEQPASAPQPEQPQAEAVPVEAPQPGVDPEPKPAPEPESTEGPSITIS